MFPSFHSNECKAFTSTGGLQRAIKNEMLPYGRSTNRTSQSLEEEAASHETDQNQNSNYCT